MTWFKVDADGEVEQVEVVEDLGNEVVIQYKVGKNGRVTTRKVDKESAARCYCKDNDEVEAWKERQKCKRIHVLREKIVVLRAQITAAEDEISELMGIRQDADSKPCGEIQSGQPTPCVLGVQTQTFRPEGLSVGAPLAADNDGKIMGMDVRVMGMDPAEPGSERTALIVSGPDGVVDVAVIAEEPADLKGATGLQGYEAPPGAPGLEGERHDNRGPQGPREAESGIQEPLRVPNGTNGPAASHNPPNQGEGLMAYIKRRRREDTALWPQLPFVTPLEDGPIVPPPGPQGLPTDEGPKYDGPVGSCGPNDFGYMVHHVRKAADELVRATDLYSEGHYPHSNARKVPEDHPLAVALRALAKFDLQYAWYANLEHEPALFKPHEPTEEAMHRWDGPQGPIGVQG